MFATLAALTALLPGLADSALGRLVTLIVPAAAGGMVYFAAALALHAPELALLRRLRRSRSQP
jgi:hypothetical protein